jgi:hypothetical protein
MPPKIRKKGRFQSLYSLANWSLNAFNYCNTKLNACDAKTREKIKEIFDGYEFLTSFSIKFSKECNLLNSILKNLKLNGLTLATFKTSMKILSELPLNSKIRQRMECYFNKHIKLVDDLNTLSFVPVSSDIIESLFGKFKSILERSSARDFNRLVLTIPTLVGELNTEEINLAVKTVTHKDIDDWLKNNVGTTLRMKKIENFNQLNQPVKGTKPAKPLLLLTG